MAKLVRQRKGHAPVLEQDIGSAFVPLRRWRGEPRVLLEPADDCGALAGQLNRIESIAIAFAHYTDGRGFSTARLLRERHGYSGELRAVGDVFEDTLFYLSRCGFDAFELRDDGEAQGTLQRLRDFSESYQTSVEQPQPLFRRRLA